MICLILPALEDLAFREALLKDEETMKYNERWGGTINFDRSRWASWYQKWLGNQDPHYFYRYVYDDQIKACVGEVAYHYEPESDRYLVDVIIHAAYRHRGYGGQALDLLENEALQNEIQILYDDIAVGNSSLMMFLKHGFTITRTTPEVITVQKILWQL